MIPSKAKYGEIKLVTDGKFPLSCKPLNQPTSPGCCVTLKNEDGTLR